MTENRGDEGLDADLEARLAEAENQVAILEARLMQYQNALESIRSVAGKILDG